MVGKMRSLFPSTRALIIKDSKRPHGQAVKTSPSHGGIWGSIPHGGTRKRQVIYGLFFYLFMLKSLAHGELCVITHATMLHEPQNTGLAFRYMSKLTRYTITLTMFTTIPMGVPKNPTRLCGIFTYSFSLLSHGV